MKVGVFALGVVMVTTPVFAQTTSVTREVVCYQFIGAELERRDICKLQDFDTSSILTWADGTVTRIRWISRYSNTPDVDGVPAREYGRDSETLQILERPSSSKFVQCLQVLESSYSVCWSS